MHCTIRPGRFLPQAYLKPLEALARGFFFIQSLTFLPEDRRDRQSPRETSGVRTGCYLPVLLPSRDKVRPGGAGCLALEQFSRDRRVARQAWRVPKVLFFEDGNSSPSHPHLKLNSRKQSVRRELVPQTTNFQVIKKTPVSQKTQSKFG